MVTAPAQVLLRIPSKGGFRECGHAVPLTADRRQRADHVDTAIAFALAGLRDPPAMVPPGRDLYTGGRSAPFR